MATSPRAHGQQVRHEADVEAERLGDLGLVLVGADAIGGDVLEHGVRVRALLERPARPRDARLRVDDDAVRLDRPDERREREERRGRVAAGIRDQLALWR